MLFLKILGGLLALALGIYLGLAGEYRQSPEELEEALGRNRPRRRVKRYFTPLDLLRPRKSRRAARSRERRPFQLSSGEGDGKGKGPEEPPRRG